MVDKAKHAAAATILMGETYYTRVLAAVKNTDVLAGRSAFNGICKEAEIKENLWDDLWWAAKTATTTLPLAEAPATGW